MTKDTFIKIRADSEEKADWQRYAAEKDTTLSKLIVDYLRRKVKGK